jgi:hypothetical protein
MKRRRNVFRTVFSGCAFSLFIAGSVSSSFATDAFSIVRKVEPQTYLQVDRVERPLHLSLAPCKRIGLVCEQSFLQGKQQRGIASWYGIEFHGKLTKSGEKFDMNDFTIAHMTLPMGTKVLVENPETGVVQQARVNDKGPRVSGRIADLSYALAEKLGIVKHGTGPVIITVL